jgi:thymidylate kinase
MNNNIIAFSGSHGVGKSTACYLLAAQFKIAGISVSVVDEIARECPLKINKDATELTQYWIMTTQIKREIEIMHRYDYIICDRSVFDPLAYAKTLNIIQEEFYSLISNYIKKYYHLIYILNPEGFNYQIDDGIRDMDKDFRYNVFLNLVNLYDNFDIKYKIINNNNELLREIKELILLKKGNN